MAGRLPIKIYLYSSTGAFKAEYANSAAFAAAIGEEKNYVSSHGDIYQIPNGDIYATSRIGRVGILKYLKLKQSPFVRQNRVDDKFEVECYNLAGVKIATFKSEFYVRKVFPQYTGNINYDQYGKVSGLKFVKKFH